MINGCPAKDEQRSGIERQLSWRGPTKEVVLTRHDYLAGLLEWGLLEHEAYLELSELLPKNGSRELAELFGDERLSAE